MSTGAAGNGLQLRGVFDGCLSGGDTGIKRRPYHKNCKCELHKSGRGTHCKHSSSLYNNKVSYPIRRSWSEGGSLALMMANAPPSDHSSPPSCSPAGTMMIKRTQTQLVLCREEEEDDDHHRDSIDSEEDIELFSNHLGLNSDHFNFQFNNL